MHSFKRIKFKCKFAITLLEWCRINAYDVPIMTNLTSIVTMEKPLVLSLVDEFERLDAICHHSTDPDSFLFAAKRKKDSFVKVRSCNILTRECSSK